MTTLLTITLGTAGLAANQVVERRCARRALFPVCGRGLGRSVLQTLQDYIYSYSSNEFINASQYQVTQPLNGDAATVRGAEMAFQNQLRFLPGPLNGIGVYANYTFTTSSARHSGSFGRHAAGAVAPHGQPSGLVREEGGFSGRAAVNFHGSFVDVIGATNALDRYYDRIQLDVSATQRIAANLRLYVDGIDLNDALLRYYQGVSERVLQEEHYRWWTTFGVKVEF